MLINLWRKPGSTIPSSTSYLSIYKMHKILCQGKQAIWQALKKYGFSINPCEQHDGMKAEVTVGGATTPEIQVTNGLMQGCTIAPTLFNLFFNLVIEQWHKRCQRFGVEILYKCKGKLVGERTRRPLMTTAT